MRRLRFAVLFFLAATVAASAQVQERKLIDRLLEPDMSLQNSAQDKQFALSTKSNTGRQAKTKAFYVRDRPAEKQLSRQRNFLTRLFGTGRARENAAPARLRTRHTPTTPQLPTPASRHAMAKPAVPANQTYAVSEFAGTRPFLVQGKSQKALNQRPRPLTIDEVRELLNKNK